MLRMSFTRTPVYFASRIAQCASACVLHPCVSCVLLPCVSHCAHVHMASTRIELSTSMLDSRQQHKLAIRRGLPPHEPPFRHHLMSIIPSSPPERTHINTIRAITNIAGRASHGGFEQRKDRALQAAEVLALVVPELVLHPRLLEVRGHLLHEEEGEDIQNHASAA